MINEIFNIKTEKQFEKIVLKVFDYQIKNNQYICSICSINFEGE